MNSAINKTELLYFRTEKDSPIVVTKLKYMIMHLIYSKIY